MFIYELTKEPMEPNGWCQIYFLCQAIECDLPKDSGDAQWIWIGAKGQLSSGACFIVLGYWKRELEMLEMKRIQKLWKSRRHWEHEV